MAQTSPNQLNNSMTVSNDEVISISCSRDSSTYDRSNSFNQDQNNGNNNNNNNSNNGSNNAFSAPSQPLQQQQRKELFKSRAFRSKDEELELDSRQDGASPATVPLIAQSVNETKRGETMTVVVVGSMQGGISSFPSSSAKKIVPFEKKQLPMVGAVGGGRLLRNGSSNANDSKRYTQKQLEGVVTPLANNDGTTRGGRSTTYNAQMVDSLSTMSDKQNKIVVRIVTIFSVIFFLICFAMIAFTLRMSEKIDQQCKYLFYKFIFLPLAVGLRSLIKINLIKTGSFKKGKPAIQTKTVFCLDCWLCYENIFLNRLGAKYIPFKQ
jgi:hypothetical protein